MECPNGETQTTWHFLYCYRNRYLCCLFLRGMYQSLLAWFSLSFLCVLLCVAVGSFCIISYFISNFHSVPCLLFRADEWFCPCILTALRFHPWWFIPAASRNTLENISAQFHSLLRDKLPLIRIMYFSDGIWSTGYWLTCFLKSPRTATKACLFLLENPKLKQNKETWVFNSCRTQERKYLFLGLIPAFRNSSDKTFQTQILTPQLSSYNSAPSLSLCRNKSVQGEPQPLTVGEANLIVLHDAEKHWRFIPNYLYIPKDWKCCIN